MHPYHFRFPLHHLTWLLVFAGCAAHQGDRTAAEPRPYLENRPDVENPRGVITKAESMSLALLNNPRLAAYAWDIRAAEARRITAGLLPNPEAEIDVEEFGGDRRGFREAETTFVLSQRFLIGGKRSGRVRVAELEQDLADRRYETERLDVLTEVVRAFAAVLCAQERVTLTEETVRSAEEVAATVARRVEAGAASPVDLTRAQVALATARTRLHEIHRTLESARLRLAALWGSPEAVFTEAVGALDVEVQVPALAALAERLDQNPDHLQAVAELERRRAALELEQAKRYPDVTLQAGYRRLESDHTDTFVAGIAVPLPLFDRNQGGIREAEANLARGEWERKATELSIRTALGDAYAALATAVQERHAYTEDILPGARTAYEATREGYEQGTFGYLELLTAQQELASRRVEFAGVLVELHDAAARVERLVGEPLASLTPTPESDKENE